MRFSSEWFPVTLTDWRCPGALFTANVPLHDVPQPSTCGVHNGLLLPPPSEWPGAAAPKTNSAAGPKNAKSPPQAPKIWAFYTQKSGENFL